MFFVVDFETSGLTPWTGSPLTIGVVPVDQDGNILSARFYERFTHREDEPMTLFDSQAYMTDTEQWWCSDAVPNEAYLEAWVKQPRLPRAEVLTQLCNWVEFNTPVGESAFVAANPSFFDKMWLEYLFADTGIANPFHYRTLCLRSMRFGLEHEDETFGSSKGAQEPVIEHHALYDAEAEAQDLSNLIKMKKNLVEAFKNDNPAGY